MHISTDIDHITGLPYITLGLAAQLDLLLQGAHQITDSAYCCTTVQSVGHSH